MQRLRQTELPAFRALRRGGDVVCRLVGERIELEGNCVFFPEGAVEI